jgi:hypothetical protein
MVVGILDWQSWALRIFLVARRSGFSRQPWWKQPRALLILICIAINHFKQAFISSLDRRPYRADGGNKCCHRPYFVADHIVTEVFHDTFK